MSLRSVCMVGFVSAGIASCGGPSSAPVAAAPAAPVPETVAPVAENHGGIDGKTAERAPAKEEANPPFGFVVSDVAVVPARTSEALRSTVKPWIETPGFEQVLGKDWVAAYKVIMKVPGWEATPSGSFIQFVLDGQPAKPVPTFKGGVKLTDLAGAELSEGEHVLAAFACRSNHESIKGVDGISVHRFWIGKKTPGEYKSTSPMLVLGAPFGSYAGQNADEILIDWYVLNAVVGSGESAIRINVKGPGLPEEGSERLTNEWRPYLLISPHNGDYLLKVELVGKDGSVAESSTVTRTITVSGRDT